MNNDLKQFSEERLMKLSEYDCAGVEEVCSLARIALSVKQAKPVAWEVKGILCHTKEEADVFIGEPEPLYDTPQPAHTEQEPDMLGFDPALAGSEATFITNYFTPDGWKLVPIQPTEEMINAWDSDMSQSYARVHAEQIGEDEMVFAYQAMLAAAPKPESE